MNKKLIALSGWKRSGKDSVADYLVRRHGAERIAFADPLKDMVCSTFGLTRAVIDDSRTKEAPLFQFPVLVKDEVCANLNDYMVGEFKLRTGEKPKIDPARLPNCSSMVEAVNLRHGQLYWTPRALCIHMGSTMRAVDPNFWVDLAVRKMKSNKLYVISDLRYKSEIARLEHHRVEMASLRINRFDTCDSLDPSERDLDNYSFDHEISNRTTVEDLFSEVDVRLNLSGFVK